MPELKGVEPQPEPTGREQFRKVDTGNGFLANLSATTNDRLEMTVIELQNLQKNNTKQTNHLGSLLGGLEDVLMDSMADLKKEISSLKTTIKVANDKNDKLQKWFLALTIVGTALAATQVIQALDILDNWGWINIK